VHVSRYSHRNSSSTTHTSITMLVQNYKFRLLTDSRPPRQDRARERYVGLTNRVISGMLIHQVSTCTSMTTTPPTPMKHPQTMIHQRAGSHALVRHACKGACCYKNTHIHTHSLTHTQARAHTHALSHTHTQNSHSHTPRAQLRTVSINCSEGCSKFKEIDNDCSGAYALGPYGVDPVFKRGTTLYNPDFDDIDESIVGGIYNCSNVPDAT